MTKLRVGLLTSAFLIIGLSVPVSAEDAQSAQNPPITVEEEARTQEGHVSGDFVYSIKEDGTARIFQCSKKEGEVIIPETIDGYTVTELGNSVFYQAAELTSVTLPNTLQTIGETVFMESGVTSINMPDSVTSIGKMAFYQCENLRELQLSDGITEIPEHLCTNCKALEKLTLPSKLKSIGDYAFNMCEGLCELVLPDSLETIGVGAFLMSDHLGEIQLPSQLQSIGQEAFFYCDKLSLKDPQFPGGLTYIGDNAFQGCMSLTEIRLPEHLEYLGKEAFYACHNLAKVSLPDTLTAIPEGLFYFAKSLETIELPANLTTIEPQAFQYCSKLTELVIPDKVVRIGEMAFANCTGLKNAFFPESLTEIGEGCFEGNTACTAHVYLDSAAYQYVRANNIPYILRLPYTDVREGDWHYNYVASVYEMNIMTGLDPQTFGPSESLSRAQFAVILYRMEGEPDVSGLEPVEFPDVPAGCWYADAVTWANKNGIITGYTEGPLAGKFGASDSITRAQMATMMYRYAQYLGYDTNVTGSLENFPDAADVAEFSKKGMEWVVEKEIITGDQGKLNPQGTASRAVGATIITRFLDLAN